MFYEPASSAMRCLGCACFLGFDVIFLTLGVLIFDWVIES